jgi:DNA-binding protein HU-beta
VNKTELLQFIFDTTDVKRSTVETVLNGLASAAGHLSAGEELAIPGVGKLKAVAKAARTARNPKTGAPISVPASTAIKFVAAKSLKEAVQ